MNAPIIQPKDWYCIKFSFNRVDKENINPTKRAYRAL